MDFTEDELKRFWCFLVEAFEFDEEQSKAIENIIPMTQELYDSILDKCNEVGSDLDHLFYRMLDEYPDFMCNYADKIEQELREKNPNFDSEMIFTEEEREKRRQDLYARIREEYCDDAI